MDLEMTLTDPAIYWEDLGPDAFEPIAKGLPELDLDPPPILDLDPPPILDLDLEQEVLDLIDEERKEERELRRGLESKCATPPRRYFHPVHLTGGARWWSRYKLTNRVTHLYDVAWLIGPVVTFGAWARYWGTGSRVSALRRWERDKQDWRALTEVSAIPNGGRREGIQFALDRQGLLDLVARLIGPAVVS